MKYLSLIFMNICKLIKESKIFMFFFVISQIVACLAIFLLVGAIHNTRNEQKDIDLNTMFFEVCVDDENILEMQKKAENVLSVIPDDMISSAYLQGYISSDQNIGYHAVMRSDGAFFTPAQINNGDHVIRVRHTDDPDKIELDMLGNNKIGDTINVAGVEYTIAQAGLYSQAYSFPIKSASPDLNARRFKVQLKTIPDIELANNISELINENFPVQRELLTPEIPDLVSVQFNRTMIFSSIIIIALVVLNLSYCYCYLFIKRIKMFSVYKICGGTSETVSNLMIEESTVISLVCFIISVFIIQPFIPSISKIYTAALNLYTIRFFAIVGAVYIVVTILFLKLMYISLLNKSEIDLKRGV